MRVLLLFSFAQDNRLLGKFELSGLPPAPRGVPQIEVSFEIDANGILQVSAEDKGTGKSEKITITAEKGRLSAEEIERMVKEAEEFAEEDKLVKERVDARNGLEAYLYRVKQQVEGGGSEGIAAAVSADEKAEISGAVASALDWLDEHSFADAEEYKAQQKALESVVNPVMARLYESRGSASGGTGGDHDSGFEFEGL